MRVVIVGGGFAGLEAAKVLADAPARVTVVDRHNYHLFQPLLYQVAVAGLASEDIATPIRQVLRRKRNVEVRLGTVEDVDLEQHRVVLHNGDVLEWDKLILAAGAKTSYFGRDEWAKHAPGLKSIPDALEIRRRILCAFERAEWSRTLDERLRNMTFVVVGGGPTGVELAGAIAEIATRTIRKDFRHIDTREARIVLVEMLDTVLPPYPELLRVEARQMLEHLGIEVMTGKRVEAIDEDGIVVGGQRIRSSVVLWGAGVQAVPLTRKLGVRVDRVGRIVVREDLSVPGHPDVFAVGDLAHFEHGSSTPLPGVAQVAMQQGRAAAGNILADLRGEPRLRFRYKDLGTMATIGRRKAVADFFGVRTAGGFAWLMWAVVHLFWLIGFGNRVVVMSKWLFSWFTWHRSSRVIWLDRDDIRPLLEADGFREPYAGSGPTPA